MEILLVEDSLTQAQLTYAALQQAAFEHRLSVVLDGEDALSFLLRQGKYVKVPHPDLILLDLRLPKVDGLEVLAKIKNDFALKDIPVVIMTGSDDEEDQHRCEELDVNAYLTKPVSLEKFLTVLKDLREFWHEELTLPNI